MQVAGLWSKTSKMTRTAEGYAAFWQWFAAHADRIRRRSDDEGIVELDQRIRELGIDSWEVVRPGSDEKTAILVLSAPGDPQKAAACRELVASAPLINGWLFATSKPKKNWERKFAWPGVPGLVDASEWRFRVLAYPDGMFELVLVSDVDLPLNSNDLRRIVIFVVESELGEARCREVVCRISVEPEKDPKQAAGSVTTRELSNVIDSHQRALKLERRH